MRSNQKIKYTAGGLILAGALIILVCVCVLLANSGTEPGTPSVSGDSATAGSDVTVTDRISDRSDAPSVFTDVTVTDTDTVFSGSDPVATDTGHKTESTSTKTKPKTDTDTGTSTKTGTADKPTDTATDTNTDTDTNTNTNTGTGGGTKKRVAITFDDGPYTLGRNIADEIAKYNGHVTFFVVGNRISGKWKDAMVYAYQKGNEIGIHAYTHDFKYTANPAAYEAEIAKTAVAIKDAIGVSPTLFRPVGGSIPKDRIGTCGYPVIHWAVDSEDWQYKKPEGSQEKINTIVNNVMKNVKDGDIILFHEIYRNSYDAFCICLKQLSAQGYEFVTVSELLNDPPAGKIYYRAG